MSQRSQQAAGWLGRWGALGLLLLAFTLASPAAFAQTLERIAAAKTVKMGVREDARPFSFKNDAGEAAGYTVDLCREIAVDLKAHLGLEELTVEFVAVGTEDRFQAIVDGKIDLLCGSTTATLSRRELVSFSIPTFITGVSALLRSDAPLFLRETLSGKRSAVPPRARLLQAFADRKFGVRAGTTAETWLRESIGDLATNAEVVALDDYKTALESLRNGDIDALFADRALLLGLVAEGGIPGEFEVGLRFYTHEPYALAMPRGDEEFRLLVDRSLSRIYRSDSIKAVMSQNFGPLSEAISAMFVMMSLPE